MSNAGKILVTGATGNVGGALLQMLAPMDVSVRALVHNEEKAQGIRDTGVEVVVGDLMQPETLAAAFEGVDKVFLSTPVSPDAAKMASNAIAAAKQAGNPHVVRLSEASPEPVSALRHAPLHAQVNVELKESGLPYTLLKPNMYMQNIMLAAQSIASDGAIYLPFKEGRLGMIDIRDVAEIAAKALTSDGHEGETYELTGPESISINEVASAFSKVLDKDVNYMNVPMEAARESMLGMGFPEWVAEAFCEYFQNYSEGGGSSVTGDFERLTGKSARAIGTFAQEFAGYFGG